ncbi:MAG: hypothetical protein WC295_11470 [Methanoregula sp.]|jgi:hypothetical protein|nr:hypothetical protein [Methanoregula sp.]
MDDLIFTGTVAVCVVYAGIACLAVAVLLLLGTILAAIFSGNFRTLTTIGVAILGVCVIYGGIGLLLRWRGVV